MNDFRAKHCWGSQTWAKVQETPLEIALAFTAMFAGVGRLMIDHKTMTTFALMVWITFLLGGVTTLAGRLSSSLAIESSGLSLLVGAYWFTSLRSIARSESGGELLIELLRYGAVAVGLCIRVYVVRKGIKAARVNSG